MGPFGVGRRVRRRYVAHQRLLHPVPWQPLHLPGTLRRASLHRLGRVRPKLQSSRALPPVGEIGRPAQPEGKYDRAGQLGRGAEHLRGGSPGHAHRRPAVDTGPHPGDHRPPTGPDQGDGVGSGDHTADRAVAARRAVGRRLPGGCSGRSPPDVSGAGRALRIRHRQQALQSLHDPLVGGDPPGAPHRQGVGPGATS